MADTFTFELVSPEKVLISKQVAMVTVPGVEGEFGVLPDHAPMIVRVAPGVIQTYENANAAPSERIFVSGGFAEISRHSCTVLADEAIDPASLKGSDVESEVKELEVQLLSTSDADKLDELMAKMETLQAKLQAVA